MQEKVLFHLSKSFFDYQVLSRIIAKLVGIKHDHNNGSSKSLSPRFSSIGSRCPQRRTVMNERTSYSGVRKWSRCSAEDLLGYINNNGGHEFCLSALFSKHHCPSKYILEYIQNSKYMIIRKFVYHSVEKHLCHLLLS